MQQLQQHNKMHTLLYNEEREGLNRRLILHECNASKANAADKPVQKAAPFMPSLNWRWGDEMRTKRSVLRGIRFVQLLARLYEAKRSK